MPGGAGKVHVLPKGFGSLNRGLPPAEPGTRRAAHIVANVRQRLSTTVPGLREEEIQPPVGNALNHNLIMELLVSTTLTASDLDLLDD